MAEPGGGTEAAARVADVLLAVPARAFAASGSRRWLAISGSPRRSSTAFCRRSSTGGWLTSISAASTTWGRPPPPWARALRESDLRTRDAGTAGAAAGHRRDDDRVRARPRWPGLPRPGGEEGDQDDGRGRAPLPAPRGQLRAPASWPSYRRPAGGGPGRPTRRADPADRRLDPVGTALRADDFSAPAWRSRTASARRVPAPSPRRSSAWTAPCRAPSRSAVPPTGSDPRRASSCRSLSTRRTASRGGNGLAPAD